MRYKTVMIAIFTALITISVTDIYAQRTVKTQKQKIQNITINLTQRGYQPSSFRLKKDIPARVTFIRKTADECGEEIVIPAYNIRRRLPLGKAVTMRFTPRRVGTFGFACGMEMLHGKLIVR